MSITDQSNVIARKGSVIWDLRTEAADLVDCLPASARTILDNIRQTGITFAARTTSPFDEPRFFRPSRHIRGFYQRVDDWQDGDSEAVVAYKGSEVWSEDLKSVAAAMSEGRTCLNKHDYFIMEEGKTPIVYLKHEAMSDAQKGLSLFRAVRSAFHYHPQLPLPLCVVQWPSVQLETYYDAVLPYLSPTAQAMVQRNLLNGIAEYVYFFPGSPARLRHQEPDARQLTDLQDAFRTVDRWVTLFTQILCSGYLPCVLSNQKWGCCVQDQNVCMDGGFVDVDSVASLTEEPMMFGVNLLASVQMLAHSIYVFLSPSFIPEMAHPKVLSMGNVFGGSLHQMFFLPHVWRMVEKKFNQLSLNIRVDERLVSIFGAESRDENGLIPLLHQVRLITKEDTTAALTGHTSV